MSYRELLLEPVLERWMVRFGHSVRAARISGGLSQRSLAGRSGVDQPSISRLEKGRTPYMSLMRVARLSVGLGGRMPVGTCPHPHDCPWSQPMVQPGELLTYTRHRQLLEMGLTERAHLDMLDPAQHPDARAGTLSL